MPIYEYECLRCETHFEKRQSFNDDARAECPSCQSPETRRLIAAPAVVFKGSGFYVTDNRNGKSSSSPPASKTKTETPPENKPEKTPTSSKTESSPSQKETA